MSLGEIIRQRRESLGLTQDQLALQVNISKPYLSNIETGKAKNPPSDGVLTAIEGGLSFEAGELTRIAHLVRTPPDVRDEHELLEAEVQKLRSVIKALHATAPRKAFGGVDLDALAGQIRTESNTRHLSAGARVPVINKLSAGYPLHFTDLDYPPSVAEEYVRCPDIHDSQAFAARVVGDSMEPRYREGDIIVFSPAAPARTGDDCFIRFEGDGRTTFKRLYVDDEESIRLQPLNSKYPAETYSRNEVTGVWPAVLRIEQLRSAGID